MGAAEDRSVERKARLKAARQTLVREHVLDAAQAVFADAGYDAAKMQDIAHEGGVSLATIYRVFGSKSDLFAAIHRRHAEALLGRASEAARGEHDPLSLLMAGAELYVRYHLDHPTYLRMHLKEDTVWAAGGTMRTEEQEQFWQRGFTMLQSVFRAGIAMGVFVPDDPAVLARTMIAMDQVRLADWVDRGADPGEADALVAAIQAQRVRAFCPSDVIQERAGL